MRGTAELGRLMGAWRGGGGGVDEAKAI